MTKEQALDILDKATAGLRLSREEHLLIIQALKTLTFELEKAEHVQRVGK